MKGVPVYHHNDSNYEWACQIVNLALELAAPDAYTVPLFDEHTQKIVQELVEDALNTSAKRKQNAAWPI